MDVPKAPKLLGSLVGLGIAENAVPITKLADLYGKVEDTETRRQGVAEALLYVKASTGPPSNIKYHRPALLLSGTVQLPAGCLWLAQAPWLRSEMENVGLCGRAAICNHNHPCLVQILTPPQKDALTSSACACTG